MLVSCGLSAVGRLASAMSGGPPPPCSATLPSPNEHQPQDVKDDLAQSQSPGVTQPPAPRRKLENADSSYDSDFDPCDVISTTTVATQKQELADDEVTGHEQEYFEGVELNEDLVDEFVSVLLSLCRFQPSVFFPFPQLLPVAFPSFPRLSLPLLCTPGFLPSPNVCTCVHTHNHLL